MHAGCDTINTKTLGLKSLVATSLGNVPLYSLLPAFFTHSSPIHHPFIHHSICKDRGSLLQLIRESIGDGVSLLTFLWVS